MMESAIRTFFSSSRFAVVGASSDPAKFGNKILAWYVSRNIPVTPINNRSPSVTVSTSRGKEYSIPTVSSPTDLTSSDPFLIDPNNHQHQHQHHHHLHSSVHDPASISLSIVTPPAITLSILEQARDAGIRRLWFQPGAFDEKCISFVKEANPPFEVAIVPGRNQNMATSSTTSTTTATAATGDAVQASVPKRPKLERSRGSQGWCVLADGDAGLSLMNNEAKI